MGEEGNWTKSKRIDYARRLLQKNFLPHIGLEMGANSSVKKSFYLGYMVHKLLNCSLNRSEQEDRDHISNKRMDLAGPMIARLFHGLLYRYCKELQAYMAKTINSKKGFGAIKLATGAKVSSEVIRHAVEHHHGRSSVLLRHWKLGRSLPRRPHIDRRFADVESPHVLVVAVESASLEVADRHVEQSHEAASAAQHAVGHDVPRRNSGRAVMRDREEPGADELYFCWKFCLFVSRV